MPTQTEPSVFWGTGRRKESRARVRLTPGSGKLLINSVSLEQYFGGNEAQKEIVMAPLHRGKGLTGYDIYINAEGGGITGQAEAIRMGISRALLALDPANRQWLRKEGFLTRDSRMVERKKSGQPKARKRFQHSKR